MGSTFRRSFTLLATVVLCLSLVQGTAHAAPTITTQPASETGAVNGTVSLSVLALGGPGGGLLTYQWRKGTTNLSNRAAGGGLSGIAGATGDTLTISSLQTADFGSDYNVIVTDNGGSVTSQNVSISPSQGSFNALGGTAGSGVNNSAFIALTTGTVPSGATISASIGGVSTPVFAIPVGGTNPITSADNATLWVPTFAGNGFNVDLTWPGGGSASIPVNDAPVGGTSITVTQDAPGSTAITVTALTPKFSGLVEPLVETPYVTAVYIFDANTGEVVTPTRPGVSNTVSGSQLRMVDPLVLPASALGRNIRAGFVIYYYPNGYNALGSPVRYAALSEPLFMTTGGDPSQWRTVRQALPMPASGSCEDISDADFAWGTNLTGGWQRAWEPWVNPELDANGNRIGGWACMRVLVHRGGPWLVDNG